MAVLYGHNRCIELLIPVSDPQDNNSGALAAAASRGNCDGVKLLLPVSNPKDTSTALIAAAQNGNAQCVRILLPVSDPLTNNSAALMVAAKNGHHKCVDILAPVSNVEEVYSLLQKAHPSEQLLLQYMEEKVWELQQQRLGHAIDTIVKEKTQKTRKI